MLAAEYILTCCRFPNNEEVEIAFGEWLRKQQRDSCLEVICELVPKWESASVTGDVNLVEI